MKIRALVQEPVPAWLDWRIINPYWHLRNNGVDATKTWLDVSQSLEDDVDILVLPRVLVSEKDREPIQAWLQAIRTNGTKIVYEADDDIFSESYVAQLTQTNWTPDKGDKALVAVLDELEQRRHNAVWTLQQCDAVTVSTKALGLYVQTLTDKPVHVVPNAIDIRKFTTTLVQNPILQDDKFTSLTTVGWAGGRRAASDLEVMVEGWCRVATSRSNVRFVVSGWMPDSIVGNKWLADRVVHNKWTPVDKYGSSMQVDIGCCAVDDNPFSQRKSPIKAWEFALAGAAVVASETVYGEEPTILLARDAQDWYQQIRYYVDNPTSRTQMAKIFQTHVHGYHNLASEWYSWLDAYEYVLGVREDDSKAVPV